MLTDAQLAVVRSWVGPTVTESTLNERYTRLGSLDAVILEELRTQLANLIDQPSQVSLPGGLNVTIGQNITAIQQLLAKFESSGGTDGTPDVARVGVSRLRRPDYR